MARSEGMEDGLEHHGFLIHCVLALPALPFLGMGVSFELKRWLLTRGVRLLVHAMFQEVECQLVLHCSHLCLSAVVSPPFIN